MTRITFGLPDTFVQHGSRGRLLRFLGLMPEQMAKRIQAVMRPNMKENPDE